jgi:hypothetical protein
MAQKLQASDIENAVEDALSFTLGVDIDLITATATQQRRLRRLQAANNWKVDYTINAPSSSASTVQGKVIGFASNPTHFRSELYTTLKHKVIVYKCIS